MSIHILVVDDDPDIRFIASKILTADGNEADEAGDLDEMFSLLDGGLRPDVILLDLTMPGPSGWTAITRLQANPEYAKIPVVILTSSKEEKDLVNSYRLGVNAYIQKPVDFDQFRSVVKEVGLFWLVVNQPPPPAALKPK